VRVVSWGRSLGGSWAFSLSLTLSLVAFACLAGLSSLGGAGRRDLGVGDGSRIERKGGREGLLLASHPWRCLYGVLSGQGSFG
jgi:hypothetical protein